MLRSLSMREHFEVYFAVDWSARNSISPKRASPDAVWIAEEIRLHDASASAVTADSASCGDTTAAHARYFRTRAQGIEYLHDRLVEHVNNRRRALVGFDFPFGFPAGFRHALGINHDESSADAHGAWYAVWEELSRLIHDDGANRNNRFEVAAELNRRCTDGYAGPFWGHPHGRSYEHLSPRSPQSGYPVPTIRGAHLDRLRATDRREKGNGIQPVWKLYGPASVGSQALLGIPWVHSLRRAPALERHLGIWPFETGFSLETPGNTVVFAEIWPNLFPRDTTDPIRDRAQVTSVARGLAALDEHQSLTPLFSEPAGLNSEELRRCLSEEAWIAGAGLRDYIAAHLQ